MEHFIEYLRQNGFSENDAAEVARSFQFRAYAKDDYFLQEGDTSHHLAFIESGFFQYFYTHDGQEITSYITGPLTFLASLSSFFRQKFSRENVRALTPARLWLLHRTQLERLNAELPSFKDFYLHLLEYQIVCIDDSRLKFITLTAEQRYEQLLHDEPQLLQQISLQHLANMMGITPRHLSRIRKNIR